MPEWASALPPNCSMSFSSCLCSFLGRPSYPLRGFPATEKKIQPTTNSAIPTNVEEYSKGFFREVGVGWVGGVRSPLSVSFLSYDEGAVEQVGRR